MSDVLEDYEQRISSRVDALKTRAGLLPKIRNEDDDWGMFFDLPLNDSQENKLEARRKNIQQMRKELKFLEDTLFNYELVVEARQKELSDG
jgi:hypothetical protein